LRCIYFRFMRGEEQNQIKLNLSEKKSISLGFFR
jgi:hypothetical protein